MTSFFTTAQRRFVEAIAGLSYCNPFLPQRIEYERAGLGDKFDAASSDWNLEPRLDRDPPNLTRLLERAQRELAVTHKKLLALAVARRPKLDERDVKLYEDLVLFVLYYDHRDEFDRLIADDTPTKSGKPGSVFRKVQADAERYYGVAEEFGKFLEQLPHVFAGFFQIRRAFNNIFSFIVGRSATTVNLRAAVWQSIFTHDMRRYRRLLFDRMGDYATLITGPSGTGKELVAQAIGLSRYIPFDAKAGRFKEHFGGSFFPISLSAMSPTLIESELFGHQRGAFTGAISDRVGWLEACSRSGTVFLDEIGDLDPHIQVKLLRVLQSREFSRLGETERRHFQGKIIAATNRQFDVEMRAGRFREDLYYRLCSDIVAVPSLQARLDDDPQELHELTLHIAQRLAGDEAEDVAREVEEVIRLELGASYAWPGNIRELEQCVRNTVIRRTYRPRQLISIDQRNPEFTAWTRSAWESTLTADELLGHYCRHVYEQTGSYEATARKLGLDRRTVKAKIQQPELS